MHHADSRRNRAIEIYVQLPGMASPSKYEKVHRIPMPSTKRGHTASAHSHTGRVILGGRWCRCKATPQRQMPPHRKITGSVGPANLRGADMFVPLCGGTSPFPIMAPFGAPEAGLALRLRKAQATSPASDAPTLTS